MFTYVVNVFIPTLTLSLLKLYITIIYIFLSLVLVLYVRGPKSLDPLLSCRILVSFGISDECLPMNLISGLLVLRSPLVLGSPTVLGSQMSPHVM